MHYMRLRRAGTVVARRCPTIAERFWAKVDRGGPDDCWLWRAATEPAGYGHFKLHGRPQRAHRVAFELLVAPIPEGMHLDHLCRMPGCVNPRHLEPVTPAENNRPGATHCPRGPLPDSVAGEEYIARKRSAA